MQPFTQKHTHTHTHTPRHSHTLTSAVCSITSVNLKQSYLFFRCPPFCNLTNCISLASLTHPAWLLPFCPDQSLLLLPYLPQLQALSLVFLFVRTVSLISNWNPNVLSYLCPVNYTPVMHLFPSFPPRVISFFSSSFITNIPQDCATLHCKNRTTKVFPHFPNIL